MNIDLNIYVQLVMSSENHKVHRRIVNFPSLPYLSMAA